MTNVVVGSIFITTRYILFTSGLCENTYARNIVVDETSLKRVRSVDGRFPSKAEFERKFLEAVRALRESAPNLKAVAIGSCVALRSSASHDRDDPKSGYGVIARNAMLPNWNGVNLYALACKALDGLVEPRDVYVRSDVSLASIGEFHWRLERDLLADVREVERLKRTHSKDQLERAISAQSTLAYLKLSEDINGAVTYNGDLLGGKNHPFLSLIKPRRMVTTNASTGHPERDNFVGICKFHYDCYSGMISTNAIEERLRERGETGFARIAPDHPICDVLVYYAAQLCVTLLATHVPSLIVLGGRLIHDRLAEGETDKHIADRVNLDLRRQLKLDDRKVEVPHFPDLSRADGYVQRAACPHPGVYGGLVLAAKKYQDPNGTSRLHPDMSN